MAREKDALTLRVIEDVQNLAVGEQIHYHKGTLGYNNLALLRKNIRRRLYTYFPSYNIMCERVYETPRAFVRIIRTA